MRRLVALDLPGGRRLPRRAASRASTTATPSCPVDQRLPAPAPSAALRRAAPGASSSTRPASTALAGGRADRGRATPSSSPTSGTTGEPKGVVLTHATRSSPRRGDERRASASIPTRDRWLCLPAARPRRRPLGARPGRSSPAPRSRSMPGFDADAVARRRRTAARPSSRSSRPRSAASAEAAEAFRAIVLGGSAPPERPPPTTSSRPTG